MAISSTVFDSIPAALRVPGWYIEFNNRLAGNAVFQGKLLVIGQKTAAGTREAGKLVRFTNDSQGDEWFGRGSMIAEMMRAIKGVDQFTETWAVALDDADAAVAAEGGVSVTDEPTETRPLALYVAGYRVWVEVRAGDDPQVVAQSIADAVNGDTRLPVSAAIDGDMPSKVVLTCK